MVEPERDEEAIFHAARRIDSPEERDGFLAQACGDDGALRGRILALLAVHEQDSRFLAPVPGAAPTADRPSHVGPYRLLERVGEGGMGEVWLAEQQEPVRRRVAVKLIRAGMDTAQVVARFEAERQALALMDHPGIARVLDGGATGDGRPYFVMELIQGVPITQYCDDHRLTPRQRLELVVPVCQAIQHAHQKGIIHRDLKPSNVLVTLYDGKPVPKVIDFGIAKAVGGRLTEKTLFTEFGAVVGTLEYMSPEQAELNNLDIDTRSDVYSLGVLLYELLTGTTPLNRDRVRDCPLLEVLRRIREEEPERPSVRLSSTRTLPAIAASRGLEPRRLSGLLRHELDWVVMRCLEKSRERRYESASALALDLQRYLADEPVLACPPSALYRLGKLARRHRTALAVAGLALAFVVLLGGGGGWAMRDRAARRARIHDGVEASADQGFAHADRALTFVDHPERWKGELDAALAALDRARLLAASDARPLEPPLQERLAALAARLERDDADRRLVGDVERIRLEQSQTVLRENRFAGPETAPRYRAAFAAAGLDARQVPPEAAVARLATMHPTVRATALAGLDDWFRLLVNDPADPPEQRWVGAVLLLADPDSWNARVRTALRREDLRALRALAAGPEADRQPPTSLVHLAQTLAEYGDSASAVGVLRRAVRQSPGDFWANHHLATALARSADTRPEGIVYFRIAVALRPRSAGVWVNFGNAWAEAGDLAEAERAFQRAAECASDYAWAYGNLGVVRQRKRDWPGALSAHRKAVELAPTEGRLWSNYGAALEESNDLEGALRAHEKAATLAPDNPLVHNNRGVAQRRWGDRTAAVASYLRALALEPNYPSALVNLGDALRQQGNTPHAVAAFRKAVALAGHPTEAHYHLGLALTDANDHAGAAEAFVRAAALSPDFADVQFRLGHALLKLGERSAAVACFREAVRVAPDSVTPHNDLGHTLEASGDLAGAVAAYRQAVEAGERSRASARQRFLAHYNLGSALRVGGDLRGAVTVLRKAISYDRTSAAAHNNLGLALLSQGQAAAAEPVLRKAVALDGHLIQAHNNLGLALRGRGDVPGALAAFRRAVELEPGYVDARLNLGSTLSLRGEHRAAMPHYGVVQRVQPGNPFGWFYQAIAALAAGDPEAYRQACAGLRAQPATTADPEAACLLLYATATDRAGGDPAALAAARKAAAGVRFNLGCVQGALLYRAGKFEEAVRCFEAAARTGGLRPWDWLFLAMAHQRLGRSDDARHCRAQADRPTRGAWYERLATAHLRREADRP